MLNSNSLFARASHAMLHNTEHVVQATARVPCASGHTTSVVQRLSHHQLYHSIPWLRIMPGMTQTPE